MRSLGYARCTRARDMISPTHHPTTDAANGDTPDSFWRRLLYRWFVEYNPLYLLSASLVLGGMVLLSRGLARAGSVHGELAVAAIAELYAFALIGGAALLTRIGHRRPAVMLALLTVLYQCDLTLHTETCAHLGSVGVWAAGAWLALFVGKLHALGWAMKLRVARSALATAMLGALGLAVGPLLLSRMDAREGSALVAMWLCGLAFLYRSGAVKSRIELDAWGRIVLRRAVGATWILSALLFGLHVLFWSAHYRVELSAVACVLPVLATRWIRAELRVWGVIVATLLAVAMVLPAAFAVTALVSAVALASRAIAAARSPDSVARSRQAPATPYRMVAGDGPTPALAVDPAAEVPEHVVPGGPAAMVRLATGAVFALYLAIWTEGWSGGAWPAHVLALDALLAVAVVVGVWKLRARLALAPFAASSVHFVVQARLVPAPRSAVEWGGAAVGLGFVLLFASLAASYWLRPQRRSSDA